MVTPVPEKGGGAHIRDSSLAQKRSALPKGFFFFLFAFELTFSHCHQSPERPPFTCVQHSGCPISRWRKKSRVCWPVRGWSHRPGPRCSLSHGDLSRGC